MSNFNYSGNLTEEAIEKISRATEGLLTNNNKVNETNILIDNIDEMENQRTRLYNNFLKELDSKIKSSKDRLHPSCAHPKH